MDEGLVASSWWVATVVGLALVLGALRAWRAAEDGGRLLAAALTAVALWCATAGVAVVAVEPVAGVAIRTGLAAMAVAAVAWAAFAARYAGVRLPDAVTAALAITAVPLVALAWTDAGSDAPARIHAAVTTAAASLLLLVRWLRGGSVSDVRYLTLAGLGALPLVAAAPLPGPLSGMATVPVVAGLAGLGAVVLLAGRRLFEPAGAMPRSAFDASSSPQLVVDPVGRVLDVNPAAERWTGVPLRAAHGRPLTRVAPLLASSAPGGEGTTFELRDDDRGRIWSVEARPLGRGRGRLWTLRDITVEANERERAERRARLLAAAAALGRDAPGTGDELDDALSVVGGALDLTSAELIEDDGTGEAFRTLASWHAEPSAAASPAGRRAYVDDGLVSVRDAIRRGRATLVAVPTDERVRSALPVRNDDGSWAALLLNGADPDRLHELRDALDVLAASVSTWSARRRAEARRVRDDAAHELLQTVTRDLLRGSDRDPWRRALDGAADAVGDCSGGALFLRSDGGAFQCVAAFGAVEGVATGVRRDPDELGIGDPAAGDELAGVQIRFGRDAPAGRGTCLVAPVVRDGRTIAVVRLDRSDDAAPLGAHEADILAEFVAQVGAVLERIGYQARSDRTARAQRRLARIERLLLSADGIETFFPLLAGLLFDGELLRLHRVGLFRVDGEPATLTLYGPEGRDPELEVACVASGLPDAGLDDQARGPTPSIRDDLARDPRWAPFTPEAKVAAVFPLRRGTEPWGALVCTAGEPDAFGREAIAWFGQLASALEIAMLRDADRQAREHQLTTLRALNVSGHALLEADTRSEVVERSLTTLLAATSADRVEMFVLDEGARRLRRIGVLGASRDDAGDPELEEELEQDEGLPWTPVRSGRSETVLRHDDARSAAWMGTPVRNGDGRVVGVLAAGIERPGARFGADDVGVLEAVAQSTGGALVRLALLERSRRQAEDFRRLWEEARRGEERFRLLAENVGDAVCLHDAEGRIVYASPATERTFGLTPEALVGRHPLDLVVVEDRETAADAWEVGDGRADGVRETVYRVLRSDGDEAWIETQVRAVRDEHGATANLVTTSRDVTQRMREQERLVQGALYDGLTGLPNRALLRDRMLHAIERARRSTARFALLFLDLDGFKEINDVLGHSVGDRMLAAVGQRLSECVRGSDTVARLGGDEFCVLVESVEDDDVVLRTAERIQAALSRPFQVDGNELVTSASIGIAFSRPDYLEPDEILRDADLAMYRAKASGKARHEVYARGTDGDPGDRMRSEAALLRAIEEDELRLAFQPIVAFGDGRVVGLEALVRWQHPQRGLLSAAEFVPFAEQTGLILQIDRWVLDRACRQLASWSRSYPEAATWTLTVNLSPMHFALPGPAEALLSQIGPSGLPPSRLRLELHERVVRQRGDAVPRALAILHEHGVDVGLEDFGTGDVSIQALQKLGIGWLKLDRDLGNRLTGDPLRRELAGGIEALARGLGIEAVAEGVEQEADRDALRDLGYVLGQGWYWSEALPPDELVARYLAPKREHDARA